MAAAFLLFFSNDSLVRALFVLNNVLVIGFTVAMIVYLLVVPVSRRLLRDLSPGHGSS